MYATRTALVKYVVRTFRPIELGTGGVNREGGTTRT